MMCLYPFDDGKFGRMSTSKQYSGPKVNSVLLSIFGRFCLVSIRLLAMQSGQLITQALIFRFCPTFLDHLCYARVFIGFPCSVNRSSGTICFGMRVW